MFLKDLLQVPLLSLLYINYLNDAIKFCKLHYFADETNLLYLGKSIKNHNKFVNIDLKNLVNWLNANKISLNVKKTEMVIFKSKRKKFNDTVKIILSGKRIYPTASVKYLGVKIDQHLTWQHHINDLSVKLNRANALLFKIRKFVDDKILRSIYFAIFESNLNYCSLVWAQNYNAINRLVILQKKALRIMNYQPRNSHTSPLFRKAAVLKFKDKTSLENILFISKSINNLLPSLFNNWFVFSSDIHRYNTSWSSDDKLQKYSYRTNTYRKNSIIISTIESWNNSQNNLTKLLNRGMIFFTYSLFSLIFPDI